MHFKCMIRAGARRHIFTQIQMIVTSSKAATASVYFYTISCRLNILHILSSTGKIQNQGEKPLCSLLDIHHQDEFIFPKIMIPARSYMFLVKVLCSTFWRYKYLYITASNIQYMYIFFGFSKHSYFAVSLPESLLLSGIGEQVTDQS